MKRCVVLLFAALVTLPLSAGSVVGLSSAPQTLRWGVAESQEFEFRLHIVYNDTDVPTDGTMWLRVDALPELLTEFTTLRRIPIVLVSARWENGTQIEDCDSFYLWVDRFVLPVGDWPLVESYITEETMDNFSIVKSHEFWGFEWSMHLDKVTETVRVVYFTGDGFLSHYSLVQQDDRTGDVIMFMDSARQGLTVGLDEIVLTSILPAAFIVAAFIGTSFAMVKLRRAIASSRASLR